jgi:uncharacterized protein
VGAPASALSGKSVDMLIHGELDLVNLGWLAAASGLAGGFAGVLAGLFGVGGGTVIVPALYQVFGLYGVTDDIRMQLCVGTSLAIIIPTSISSFREHYQRGTVDLQVLRAWIAPIAGGVVAGVFVAAFAGPFVFKIVFVSVCLFLAVRLLAGKDNWKLGGHLPGDQLMASYGVAIGALASIMGVGGGLLANIVLSFYGRPIRNAVSTASGVGVIVSIPGALGYVVAGWGQTSLPPGSMGYVSGIAFALLTPVSLLTVPYGVALAHHLEKRHLEFALAIYLIFVSADFVSTLLWRF